MRSSADDEAPLKILSFLFSPNRSKHNKGNKPLNNITATKKKKRRGSPSLKQSWQSLRKTPQLSFAFYCLYATVLWFFLLVIYNLPVLPGLEPSNLSQGGLTVPNQLHYAAGLCEFIEIGTRHGLFIWVAGFCKLERAAHFFCVFIWICSDFEM